MKRIVLLSLLALTLCACGRPKGFTLKKITSCHPPSEKWEVQNHLPLQEVKKILSQPYTYLGSGNHTYVFASEDGRYVLKFFKQKHMNHPLLASSTTKARRKKEREETFSSYKIAFETLANETKTLYLHLNRTKHLKVPLTLIDQHGKTLKVAADKMEFLIQRRAVLALDYLRSLTDPEAIADGALSLLRIAQERNRQGIDDKDLQFFKNFGFVDGEAVEIDIGELTVDSPPKPLKQELETLSLQLQEFIAEETPAALPLFKRKRDLLFRSLP